VPSLVHHASDVKARLPSLNVAKFQASLRDAAPTINGWTRHSSAPFKVRQAITYNLQLVVNLGGFKDIRGKLVV
jgi:hypothetical protein